MARKHRQTLETLLRHFVLHARKLYETIIKIYLGPREKNRLPDRQTFRIKNEVYKIKRREKNFLGCDFGPYFLRAANIKENSHFF